MKTIDNQIGQTEVGKMEEELFRACNRINRAIERLSPDDGITRALLTDALKQVNEVRLKLK